MTLEEFYALARQTHSANPTWRWGQTVFNCLSDVRPDLSDKIRGSWIDPFYREASDDKFKQFETWLAENWALAPR